MHPYSIDTDEKRQILLFLAAASILLAYLLNWVVTSIGMTIPWWLDAPSVMGFYGILYWLFDNYLWAIRYKSKCGLSQIPILKGTWEGCVSSSHDHFQGLTDCKVDIYQNWNSILVCLETKNSKSESKSCSISLNSKHQKKIAYTYTNIPGVSSVETMQIHTGTTELTLSEDGNCLEGNYYTGRGRVNYGSIKLTRKLA